MGRSFTSRPGWDRFRALFWCASAASRASGRPVDQHQFEQYPDQTSIEAQNGTVSLRGWVASAETTVTWEPLVEVISFRKNKRVLHADPSRPAAYSWC